MWLDAKARLIRTVLSSKSNSNTLLLTERCDNRCLFCSQPPNDLNDTQLYLNATISLLNFNTSSVVGLSGGEPTNNDEAFITMLSTLNSFNNTTPLHILSNGRRFREKKFSKAICDLVGSRAVTWGIPLYGHRSSIHDCLVQAENAFNETIRGLSNLVEGGQEIELRIVPVKQNVNYVSKIVQFVLESFPYIKTISIMNMEPKGWARKNYADLFVSVDNQNSSLLESVELCDRYDVSVQLFNYPLCLLDTELRNRAVKSISDWKNYYLEECDNCSMQSNCGGFFTSANGKFIEEIKVQL